MQQNYHLMCGHSNVESFTYESVTNVTYELASLDLQSRHYSRIGLHASLSPATSAVESGRKKRHLACTHSIPTFLSYFLSGVC